MPKSIKTHLQDAILAPIHICQFGHPLMQALQRNVECRRAQKRYAKQRSGPATMRRCWRLWLQSAANTKAWLVQVRSPVLLARGFAAWQYHLQVTLAIQMCSHVQPLRERRGTAYPSIMVRKT